MFSMFSFYYILYIVTFSLCIEWATQYIDGSIIWCLLKNTTQFNSVLFI